MVLLDSLCEFGFIRVLKVNLNFFIIRNLVRKRSVLGMFKEMNISVVDDNYRIVVDYF